VISLCEEALGIEISDNLMTRADETIE